jgi:GDP-4-dehydro-6-deoxy-D-mannose reductase
MSKPKILITGANGFTGKHASQYFVQKGMDVTAVVRTRQDEEQAKWRTVECDLLVQSQVDDIIEHERPDYILHLAGRSDVASSWLHPLLFFKINVLATLFLLEAVRRYCPDARTVVVGSIIEWDITAHASHPYGVIKAMQVLGAKAWEELFKLNIYIAKPSNLIGPGLSKGICSFIAKQIVSSENKGQRNCEISIHNLLAERDFLDVRDAIRAYEIILEKGKSKKEYQIASGVSRSITEIVDTFHALTPVGITVCPTISQAEQRIYINTQEINELGWTPTYSLETSLYDILQFFHKQAHLL